MIPATAAPSSPVAKYVALGDSYASGQGAGIPLDSCLRSTASYPALLNQPSVINLLRQPACSGATIADVTSIQVASANRGTTLVTITAGANDLPITAALAACQTASPSLECQAVIAQVESTLASDSIQTGMRDLVLAVSNAAPHAHIVVTDYPVPFVPGISGITDYVNGVVFRLDAQIAAGAGMAMAMGADVEYVPMANAFAGHQVATAVPWLGAVPADPFTFLHPTAAGQDVYRAAVVAALAN